MMMKKILPDFSVHCFRCLALAQHKVVADKIVGIVGDKDHSCNPILLTPLPICNARNQELPPDVELLHTWSSN